MIQKLMFNIIYFILEKTTKRYLKLGKVLTQIETINFHTVILNGQKVISITGTGLS